MRHAVRRSRRPGRAPWRETGRHPRGNAGGAGPLGGAHRFLRSGAGLVYLPGVESKDFWLVDLATNKIRQLTDLSDRGYLNTFDITPDGKYLVFDRSRQNSDVVLIDLPKEVASAAYRLTSSTSNRVSPSISHAVASRTRRLRQPVAGSPGGSPYPLLADPDGASRETGRRPHSGEADRIRSESVIAHV